MYLDKFIEASIVALGLSPGAQDSLIVSSRGVSRSTGWTSSERNSQTLHPVAAEALRTGLIQKQHGPR